MGDKSVRLHGGGGDSFNNFGDVWAKGSLSPVNGNNGGGSPGASSPLSYDVQGIGSVANALKNTDFKDAIKVLVHLYRAFAGTIRSDEIRNFVDCFSEKIVKAQLLALLRNPAYFASVGDHFSCPICVGVLIEPITIQCGHSYCKICLQTETAGRSCRRCQYKLTSVDLSLTKVNVLLGALIEKWWTKEVKTATLRNEGNNLFESQNGKDVALSKYAEALALIPEDHLVLGHRSHVLLTLGRSEEALTDIDAAIKSCPIWTKGYFRKAAVLVSLGRYEDAFVNLVQCLCLVKAGKLHDEAVSIPDKDKITTKNEMVKVLHKIFLQAAGGLGNVTTKRRHSLDQRHYSSVKLRLERDRFDSSRVDEDSEYSSSGDEAYTSRDLAPGITKTIRKHGCNSEVKSSQYQQSTSKKNGSYQLTYDPQISKIHRLFDRALLELNRVQNEIIAPRTKSSGNPATISRHVDTSLISVSDLECTLCYRLLYEPVTTLCGHTYCRGCLERSLDHSSACPLCKTSLDYLAHRRHAVTRTLEVAVSQFLPQEHTERVQQHMDEMAEVASLGKNSSSEIPIFVCTMGFPTVPCPLHVFEPRYRLMVRRCVESGGKRFGMCCYVQEAEYNYANFGTLLEIRNVQYFADGRSVVDTIGRSRFKVKSKSQKDGYNVASIEALQDRQIEEESRAQVQEIHDKVYAEAVEWLKSINQVLRQRIHTHFGPMPDPEENWIETLDGPAWCWWLLAILPLDTKAQLAILSMDSLQKRLESIQKVLKYVKSTQL